MSVTPYTPDEIVQFLNRLEKLCRFNGAVRRFYSVAEHTSVGLWCMEKNGQSRDAMRAFLVHDLPEAVMGIGDITRNVKNRPDVAQIVRLLEEDAFARIKPVLPFDMDTYGAVVKFYDRMMAVAEVECVALGIEHDNPNDYQPEVHDAARYRIDSISTGWARYRPLINWANDLWPEVLV
jgi:hypothetical protein